MVTDMAPGFQDQIWTGKDLMVTDEAVMISRVQMELLDFMVRVGAPGFHSHRWSNAISWSLMELCDFMVTDGPPGFHGHRWSSAIS